MTPEGQKRPSILVLAGVDGAGKSSVGGDLLRATGLTWFNPDDFARELIASTGMSRATADARAWTHGKTRLEAAIASGSTFAFETTLGGSTIPRLLDGAAATHDVVIIYCGLASVETHIARVQDRVRSGGHDIPEERIRSRWMSSRANLTALLPRLAYLQVFDNSTEVAYGEELPDPILLLEMKYGQVVQPRPDDVEALARIPEWAKPILEAAFRRDARS